MLTFLYPILEAINDGPFLRQVFKWSLRGFAGIIGLVGLSALIGILKLAFNQNANTSMSVAGLVIAALIAGAALCEIQILLFRAGRIEALAGGRYIVLPAACQLLRLGGELMAFTICTLGLATFLAAVLAGESAGYLMALFPGPFERFGTSGVAGFGVFLFALAVAFLVLVYFYLMAEGLQVVLDVSEDVRFMADAPTANAVLAAAASAGPGMAAMSPKVCQACRATVPPGNAFCNLCGTAVGAVA